VIRLAVVDDQPLLRAGLTALIEHTDDLELVGEGCDGLEAVELARRVRPDVMLMDVHMPRVDGIAATRSIVADPECIGIRVVVLTTCDADEYVYAALRAGLAASCSRMPPPRSSWRPSGRSRRETHCLPRR
jgi:DNA-binding NarL/FixJ family response regulator